MSFICNNNCKTIQKSRSCFWDEFFKLDSCVSQFDRILKIFKKKKTWKGKYKISMRFQSPVLINRAKIAGQNILHGSALLLCIGTPASRLNGFALHFSNFSRCLPAAIAFLRSRDNNGACEYVLLHPPFAPSHRCSLFLVAHEEAASRIPRPCGKLQRKIPGVVPRTHCKTYPRAIP